MQKTPRAKWPMLWTVALVATFVLLAWLIIFSVAYYAHIYVTS